jgi:hypothetical protein
MYWPLTGASHAATPRNHGKEKLPAIALASEASKLDVNGFLLVQVLMHRAR